MFCPSFHLFALVCDDFGGSRLQGCNLGGTWTEGFLHAIMHGAGVATINGEFDGLTKIQQVIDGAASSDPLRVVRSHSECSECLVRRIAGLSSAILASNQSGLYPSLAKGVYS